MSATTNIVSLFPSQGPTLTILQSLSDFARSELNQKTSNHDWDELDDSGRGWQPAADGNFMFLAKSARDNGYRPLVPLCPFGSFGNHTKQPFISGWQELAANPPSDDQMRGWCSTNPNVGWGYVHDTKLIVFDIDTPDLERSAAMVRWLLGNIPGKPPMMRTSKVPKVQLYYRAGSKCHQEKTPEIFYNSGQTVLFGIHDKLHIPFSWKYGSPANRNISDLPICEGYHELKFLQAWGGPSGDGDTQARLGRGSGSVRAMLALARHHNIPVLDIDDLVKVVKAAPKGSRHNTAVAAVSYARHNMHASQELIMDTIGKAYFAMLRDSSSGRELNRHMKDFCRIVGWAEVKVDEGD